AAYAAEMGYCQDRFPCTGRASSPPEKDMPDTWGSCAASPGGSSGSDLRVGSRAGVPPGTSRSRGFALDRGGGRVLQRPPDGCGCVPFSAEEGNPMRNLLAFLGALGLTLVGVGW